MKATVSRGLAASVLVALCNDVRTAAVGEAWSDTNAIVLTWHLAGRGRMGALVPAQSRATHIPADRIPSAAIVLMQRPIEAERDGERSQLRAVARDAAGRPGNRRDREDLAASPRRREGRGRGPLPDDPRRRRFRRGEAFVDKI